MRPMAMGQSIVKVNSFTENTIWSACDFQPKHHRFFTVELASTFMIQKLYRKQSARTEFYQAAHGGGKKWWPKGVGDNAFWRKNFGFTELWVLKGDVAANFNGASYWGSIDPAKRVMARV